jgi:hypothetical protein
MIGRLKTKNPLPRSLQVDFAELKGLFSMIPKRKS